MTIISIVVQRTIMLRFVLPMMLAISLAVSASAPQDAARSIGILDLDNCDDRDDGKEEYKDNLTLLDSAGKQTFRMSGFNNCESIRSSRMIAADPARRCIWVIENVAHRIRRFDLAGKETLTIPAMNGSAIAVDTQYANDHTKLSTNAEVACIPPVSGG